ncbi:MAG: helix-turn-helix domain-containing protein [Polyangiales bacterium]
MRRDSIGALLKSQRETRELSIEEVSSTTRIPRRTLESLEDDRFEDLPSGVFVRGFVKAYASAVDIDAEEVLARLDRELPEDRLPPPRLGIHVQPGYGLLVAITTAILFAIIVATFVMVRRAPAQNEPIELSSVSACRVDPNRVEPCFFDPSTIATPIVSSRS